MKYVRDLPFTVASTLQHGRVPTQTYLHLPEGLNRTCLAVFSTNDVRRLDADIFSLILDCEAIGTAATPGLLCQPRMIVKMILEKQLECRLAGETEVLGENLPQRHFCPTQNPT
jgi:hypothetical protein